MTHYSIAPYGNNKFEVQDLDTKDPYSVVKGRYDTYESAAETVKALASRPLLNLVCCCCGSSAPAFAQWYNRDKGYGLCNKCADWISKKEDAETMETKYAVLEDTSYYGGDCQHPSGWQLRIVTVSDEGLESDAIGTLEECKGWLTSLEDGPTYLSHGQAGKSYRIALVEDDRADYNSWVDGVDWDIEGAPEGADWDINTAWAEDYAYQHDGVLPVCDQQGNLYLVNLDSSLVGLEGGLE